MDYRLKNGETVTIRPPRVEDAQGLIDLLNCVYAETRFLGREPGEFSVTLEKERAFIEGVLRDADSAWFVASCGGRIVGNCSVGRIGRNQRFRHRAELAVSIEQAHCGLGIGGHMMDCALAWCKERGIEQLELQVVANNAPALRLYQRHGFELTGIVPRALKYADGTYADEYTMVRRITGGDTPEQIAARRPVF